MTGRLSDYVGLKVEHKLSLVKGTITEATHQRGPDGSLGIKLSISTETGGQYTCQPYEVNFLREIEETDPAA